MQYGHDPRMVREYAWRDIELMLTIQPTPGEVGE